MNNKLTHKGFVCLNGDEFRLVVKDNKLFRTIPIIGFTEGLEQVNDFTAKIVAVKFYDGTEQVSLSTVVENDFEDIIISLQPNANIQIEATQSIFKIIEFNYDDLCKMWEFVDEYYKTEIGIKRFKKFCKKNIWNKNK